MKYELLKGTGIEVSKICMGAMTLGGQIDEKNGIEAVDYCLDQGINFFDTANGYTFGKSEEILGKALKGKREQAIIATKVGSGLWQEKNTPNSFGLSRRYILEQIEGSLKRLQTDYVDIYYLHAPDKKTPIEETLDTMDTLVRSGKVRYIGASNYRAWQLCQMYYHGKITHQNRPVIVQMVYNLITRGIEQELIPFLQESNMGLVVYNPIAAGFLTDKYKEKQMLPNTRFSNNKMYADRYWNEDNFAAWDDIHKIASEAGISMLELAMRWVYAKKSVDSILTGFSSLDQLKENIHSIENGDLPDDVMEKCDKIWEKLSGTRFNYYRA